MVERKFVPGSEWMYLKIYAGVKTSDIVLSEALKPLIEKLQSENIIEKWFFIRYNDPKPHLRLRFELVNQNHHNEVLENINHSLKSFIDSGEVSNIVIDSYIREIERYGENMIENAEELFCKSSELILNFLDYDDEEKIMVSLFYIDEILNKLGISVKGKLDWVNDSNITFKKEFNADKNLNRQLDKKYRMFKSKFLDFINSDEFKEIRDLIISNTKKSIYDSENIVQHYISSQYFFQSIFHMHVNRTFVSDQRLFEMIIYDYLLRYYKGMLFYNAND